MKNKKRALEFVTRYAFISFGCIVYSLGVILFLEANGLAAGGATGIALIISSVLEKNAITGFWVQAGMIGIWINIPLFIVGAFAFGKKFLFNTAYCTVLSYLLMMLWEFIFKDTLNLLPLTDNPLVAAVFGGALFGGGAGIIFRMGGSTGGTDIPVKILRKKFRHIKTGLIAMVSDVVIVSSSYFVNYDIEIVFYTLISVVVFTPVFDLVLYGGNSAKMVYVISANDKAQSICDRVLKELNTGATFIDAQGAYSGEDKRILLCVVKPFLFPKLRDVVNQEDKKAFIIVSSAKEIYGEGYQDPNGDVI